MAAGDPVILAQLAGFGIFLWLGVYLLIRAPTYRWLISVSVVGLLSQAAFFGSNVLSYTASDAGAVVQLERWFWWTAVVPVAAWFHFSSLVRRGVLWQGDRRHTRLFTPLVAVIHTAALFLVIFGTSSNLLLNYASPAYDARGFAIVSVGPFYPLYIMYIACSAAGALANFALALRRLPLSQHAGERALRQQLMLLIVGALMFLIGALWIPSRYYWNLAISPLPGYFCLLGGLAALSYGVAHFGMLLEGMRIQRDFVYSFTGIALMNLLYGTAVAWIGHISPVGMVALVGLVTLTHTTFDNGRKVLDRLFFSQDERTARAEARDYAIALGTSPVNAPAFAAAHTRDEPEPQPAEQQMERVAQGDDGVAEPVALPPASSSPPKEFRDHVRRAITGLKNPPRLAQSPLLALALVERQVAQSGQQDNRLNRAAALRDILIEQIDALRPNDEASSVVGDAWRFYNVLYYPYVRELSRKGALAEARRLAEDRRRQGHREPSELELVLSWLADIDEDTFYKWQRRASDTIASLLWEEDQKLRSAGTAELPTQQPASANA